MSRIRILPEAVANRIQDPATPFGGSLPLVGRLGSDLQGEGTWMESTLVGPSQQDLHIHVAHGSQKIAVISFLAAGLKSPSIRSNL